jgi:hypothetical protein
MITPSGNFQTTGCSIWRCLEGYHKARMNAVEPD